LVSRETGRPRTPLKYAEGDERRERRARGTGIEAVVYDLEEMKTEEGSGLRRG